MKTWLVFVGVSLMGIVNVWGAADAATRESAPLLEQAGQTALTEAKQAEVNAKMATMQIPFIANQGQMDADVAFYAKTFGGTIFVTQAGEIVYALPKIEGEETKTGVALRETLVGGNVRQVTGAGEAVTRVSYFKGNDPARWQSNIGTYQYVKLGEVYDGIDLTLKARGNNVEKLFVVQPGSAPDVIRLRVQGAQRLSVNADGELEAATELGVVKFTKPVAYQERDGQRQPVDVAYRVTGQDYGFAVGDYDPPRRADH